MDSQMESVDISSIKAAALRPLESHPADSEDPSTNGRLKAVQEAFQQSVAATHLGRSQATHQHQDGTTSQPVNVSQSLSDLPSTVPDSQAIANVEQILEEIPNATVPQVISALKKMSSQGAPQDTQPLSPAFLETYISKSRRLEVHEQETGYTHGTLQPGDEGHIDLMSSYQQVGVVLDDEDESEPIEVDFSPTQSAPSRLSQFPESQRFKTPATVGKKRKYNGDVVESPALPRNPFAGSGEPTPGRMMGLSQAFAATQAASSPFINGLPSELRSDRPSPALPVQLRPNTATDSSPTLARPLLPRSSTEPQTKYISMKESQAIREARKRMELNGMDEEDSDDSFDETPAEVRRRQERRRRDEEAQRQFAAVASSRKGKGPWSSPARSSRFPPINSSPAPSPVNGYLHPDVTSPLDLRGDNNNASEEETDQEDGTEVAARHSNQIRLRAVPEEDKENAPQGAIQIPETAALHRVMNGYAAEVEASPSVRYSSEVLRSHPASQRPEDGEPSVVVNSQPSQIRRYAINGPKLSSSGEQTDFVPQSQYLSNSTPERGPMLGVLTEEDAQSPPQRNVSVKPSLLVSKSDTRSSIAETAEETRPVAEAEVEDDEDEEPPRKNLRNQAAPQTLSNTIPETSSARLRRGISSSMDQRGEISKSMCEFETAPTHLPASSNEHDSAPAVLPSQAPVISSPARSKRKRMTDIDAEESQPHSSGPDLGELNPVLIDREYSEIVGSSSPIRPGRFAKKRRLEASPLEVRQAVSSSPTAPPDGDKNHGRTGKEFADGQEPRTTQGETPPASSDDIRTAIPRKRGLHRPSISVSPAKHVATYGKTRNKPSAWDIQASPEKRAPTRLTLRATSLRKRSSTLPPAGLHSASTSRLPRTATQRSMANSKQDVMLLATATHQPRAKAHLQDTTVSENSPEAIMETISKPVHEVNDHSAPPGDVIFPNQVLACYNGKARAYYPAACLGFSGTATLRYQIQWDGYEPDEIDEHGVRSLDLRHGDNIKINLDGFPKTPHVIRGFKNKIGNSENAVTDVKGHKTLLVAPKQRKSLPVVSSIAVEEIKEVPVSAIYLDSNMWNQMKDRRFTYMAPPTLASSTRPGFLTPIDRPGSPSTPSSRSRRLAASTALPLTAPMATGSGILANMAFAISYDSPIRKSELTSIITQNGGLVLPSGFHELLWPDAMILKPQYANLGFTALLADKHSRKEKYLQALALGLPCLSGKWLEACIASEALVNWQSYLLPAGESDELEGAVRSRVLPVHEPHSVRIADVLDSRPDILNSEPIIFVLGRGKAEEKRRPYVFLTQALGAGYIEKVSDIRAAKVLLDEPGGKEYKWVFVDDRDVESATALLAKRTGRGPAKAAGVRVVGNEFVKQSLVLGRMFGC